MICRFKTQHNHALNAEPSNAPVPYTTSFVRPGYARRYRARLALTPERQINADVYRFGWHCVSITNWEIPFLYTVGLSKTYSHPEVILFGLEPSTGHSVLSSLVRNLSNGSRYETPDIYFDILEDFAVGVKTVHESHHPTYLGYAMAFCRENGNIGGLVAVQLYWPDSRGVLPYQPNCDLAVHGCQPSLDIPLTKSENDDPTN